jgi:hypothetical protein
MSSTRKMPEHPSPAYNLPTGEAAEVAEAAAAGTEAAELGGEVDPSDTRVPNFPKSPRISHLKWGQIEVEGYPPFKDAKIFPGGAREWKWRETARAMHPAFSRPTFSSSSADGIHKPQRNSW